jgi:uncharacterized protein DUF3800
MIIAVDLILTTAKREVTLGRQTLTVWLDETGHEDFAQPDFPIFGLGGCALLASDYDSALASPWRAIKKEVFGNPTAPLHATDLRSLTREQMERLGRFFNEARFARLAAVTRKDANKPNSVTVMEVLAAMLRRWLEDLSNEVFTGVSNVALIFEESQRLNKQILSNFGHWKVKKQGAERIIDIFREEKANTEPGLEIADFIVHTAGSQARLDKWPSQRRDFNAIFLPSRLDHRWVKFKQITETAITPAAIK